MSTVGDVQYRGRYHDKCGGYLEYRVECSVPWGENLLLLEYPTIRNTPMVLMISLRYSFTKDGIPPRYS